MTKKKMAFMCIMCLIISGVFGVFDFKVEAANAQPIILLVGETSTISYKSEITRVSSLSPEIVEVQKDGNVASFIAKAPGIAYVFVYTTASSKGAMYKCTVYDNNNLVGVSYVGSLKEDKEYAYVFQVKNKTDISFDKMDFNFYYGGKLLNTSGTVESWGLSPKAKTLSFVIIGKKVAKPKKITYSIEKITRTDSNSKGTKVPKNKVSIKIGDLKRKEKGSDTYVWKGKYTVVNKYERETTVAIYGLAYDKSGKLVGVMSPEALRLQSGQKKTHQAEFTVDGTASKVKTKVWVNAVTH